MIRHIPVLATRIAELLHREGPGVWIDCTLGDGGHSQELLKHLDKNCCVVGLDRDPAALAIAQTRMAGDERFSCVHTAFSALSQVPQTLGAIGFLFDFGVSSRQLDEDERGFTIRPGVVMDLRMDTTDPRSLAEILQEVGEEALAKHLTQTADVPRSRIVAKHLLAVVAEGGILRSNDLEAALLQAFPKGMRDRPRELARLAQALRMLVNAELPEIEQALPDAFQRLAVGGRLAVLTYHSVEDRLVKNLLRRLIGDEQDAPRDLYGNRPEPNGKWIVKREDPDEAEIARNPRARSAQLRVIEKTRGNALVGVLLAVLVVGLLSGVLVGCVWRQTRHVEIERSFDSLQVQRMHLEDSAAWLAGRLDALRQPEAVAERAAIWGWHRPERQWRLPEPSVVEVKP